MYDRRAPGKVFISYRHEHSAAYAKLLYERLNRRFPDSIFVDLDSIRFGDDFVQKIEAAISSCGVLVALIDFTWVSISDTSGRRLDNPKDFVRLEIATALKRGVCVIPALLNGAPMPTAEQLPEDLIPLTTRRALRISDENLDYNAKQLSDAVERELVSDRGAKHHVTLAVLAIAICIFAQLLGSTHAISHFFIHRFGFQALRELAIGLLSITVLAYAFGFTSLYRARPQLGKFWLLCILLACSVAAVFTNLMMKPLPNLNDLLKREASVWVARIFENQNEGGGIRGDIRTPSADDQVWSTAQCLEGVLLNKELARNYSGQIRAAFRYMEQSRHQRPNQPEDGWGYTTRASRTVTEVSAWVSLAYLQSLEDDIWNEKQKAEVLSAIERELQLMANRQDPSGGWTPILEKDPNLTRTYSTLMVLWSYVEAGKIPALRERLGAPYQTRVRNGLQWLLSTYDPDYGWIPNPNRKGQQEQFPGLTAQVLFVLSLAEAQDPALTSENILKQAKSKFLAQRSFVSLPVNSDTEVPTGDVHLTDEFTAEGVQFLWYPWAMSAYKHLSEDRSLTKREHNTAADDLEQLLSRFDEVSHRLEAGQMFILAENLIGISQAIAEPTASK